MTMRTFGLHKNTVFNWKETVYKIHRANPDNSFLIERLDNGQMLIIEHDELLSEYSKGNLEANEDNIHNKEAIHKVYSRPLDELSEKVKSQIKRRQHYMNALYQGGYPKFTKEYLLPIINQAARDFGDNNPPSVITVYRWSRKFTSTQDTRSLIPKHHARGSSKRKVSDSVLKLLIHVMEQGIKTSPQCTIANIYHLLAGRIQEDNKTLLPYEQLKMPSRKTIYRLLSKVEMFDMVSLKAGKAAAEKLFRQVKGKVETTQILERVEIDHTPLDLFLIDEKTQLPLGRPTLTVIIDHFSRMLLGYYVSFQNPSTAAVMGALRHAILNKPIKSNPLPSLKIEHDWVCYGVPDLMVLDNGMEFHSDALESVAFDLGIRMEFCPKHEPRFKGTVERYLKTVNYSFASQIPGASFARWHLRKEYDPLKHAILTMGEFTHIFEKWVLDIYAQTKHSGIGTTPWDKWHEGLHSRNVTLPLSIKELQKRIGKVDSRSVRRDGILIRGIRYQSEGVGRILRRYGEGVRVRVMYDPQDLGRIQVWGPDDLEPITVDALNQSYANGLTELQNDWIRASILEKGGQVHTQESLIKARHDLFQQIHILTQSRHLSDRKRAGKLSGLSSNKAKGSMPMDNKIQQKTENPSESRPKNKSKKQPYVLPKNLPTFRLTKKVGQK